jgi:uncharacterized protein
MHPNEALIRRGFEAMANGDGSMLASLLTSTTKWIIHGEGELAGTYEGPDAIFAFWKRVAAKTGGGLRLTLDDVLANDDRAVALVRVRGRRDDRILDERQIVVFQLDESKVTSATFVYERPDVYDAFWA